MVDEQKKSPLAKLGLHSPADFALYLPIRYEDETELFDIATAIAQYSQISIQTQGRVIDSQISYRPRRQLSLRIADENAELNLRFINFYPSQQKQMAVGTFLRVRGDIRQGYHGPEMIHPSVKVCTPETPLPQQLTPVYSTIAGVSQTMIRKAIVKGLSDSKTQNYLREILPIHHLSTTKYSFLQNLPSLRDAIHLLHYPPSNENKEELLNRTHSAWRRVQLEELLAQQISLQRAHLERHQRLAPEISNQICRIC
jgi:ATP-dependent DNA helicase RecG